MQRTEVVAKFVKVTLDSFADDAAHKDSWTADSVPVQKIAKLTGANQGDWRDGDVLEGTGKG